MAKKTIISDFNSLKGKVTFTDKVTVPEASVSRSKEEGLKVGQDVVMMDSDYRGKIIGLGRTVRIELEDGLVIESEYGGFAVTEKSEIARLRETRVKRNRKSEAPLRSRLTVSYDTALTVDLHIEALPGGRNIPKGQQLQFQMDSFRRIIRTNLQHKGMKITFIHGVGDGILKNAIRKELDEILALRCSYSVGDPAVTVVSIR